MPFVCSLFVFCPSVCLSNCLSVCTCLILYFSLKTGICRSKARTTLCQSPRRRSGWMNWSQRSAPSRSLQPLPSGQHYFLVNRVLHTSCMKHRAMYYIILANSRHNDNGWMRKGLGSCIILLRLRLLIFFPSVSGFWFFSKAAPAMAPGIFFMAAPLSKNMWFFVDTALEYWKFGKNIFFNTTYWCTNYKKYNQVQKILKHKHLLFYLPKER